MRLEVRLLGGVDVVLDGRRLHSFRSPRLQRLLAMIALRPGPQHRSRLAFELWPDSNERQARTNLRKLLHELRRTLPDVDQFLDIDRESLHWNPGGQSSVDVLRFRNALAAGDLELAARVYTGDLLPGCYDNWVQAERAKLKHQALDVLSRLAESAARREDHAGTISQAQRVLELEPTDESALQLKMSAQLALDDKAAALRSYRCYAEALERELAIQPGTTVEALHQRARSSPIEHGDAPSEAAGESPFTGREQEWQTLRAAWTGARSVAAHLVLISGEPGIGKSRLAAEFGRSVHVEGHTVAAARAYEAAGRLPWGPVVELLRSRPIRSEIEALDPAWKAELARLMPELYDAECAADDRAIDPVRRHRLFDAVRQAIASGDTPRLLIIDDLQWCDAETIELIGFVTSSAATAPLLIIGTVRSEELPEGHPLDGLVHSLRRTDSVTLLPIEPLDRASTAALAAALAEEEELDPAFAARLWLETQGNPLFVVETMRAGIRMDGATAGITPTMRAVLQSRLDQLDDPSRQVAEAAAVIGRPFSFSLLAAATGIAESKLAGPVDALLRRRILRETGTQFDFSHDKLRAVTLETIGAVRRRGLHRAVAHAIAAELGDRAAAASPRLAAHYHQAGMIDAAIDAYRTAGARAVAVSALEEAVRMFEQALALMAELPTSPSRDALELDTRIALGSPLVALQGYGARSAHQLYERARALCRKLRKPVDPPILRGLGLARLQGCRFADCNELAQALLDHESRDPVTQTEGHYLRGVCAFWRGDLAAARQDLVLAIDAFDESREDEHLALYAQDPKAVCQVRLAWTELWAGDAGRAEQFARSAIARAEDLDHLMTRAYVLTYAALTADGAADYERLVELLDTAERVWERHSERYLVVILDALRGWLLVRSGSATAVDKIVDAVARSRTEGETLHLTYALLLLARARGQLGEHHEGLAAAEEGLGRTRRCRQAYLEAELLRASGELAYSCGEAEPAAGFLRDSVRVARAQGAGWLERRALDSLAARFPG